jgi:MFS family permease
MVAIRPVRLGRCSNKWVALSNTVLSALIVSIDSTIVLIGAPAIFRGIRVDPLAAGNTQDLLWLILGFLVVTAVLVVSLGRLGDIYGRVRIYNLGFVVFTVFSILLSVTWLHGRAGADWLIAMRVGKGLGGAMLLGNATAIVTDAFPVNQRGMALGIQNIAVVAGATTGLVLGGMLAPVSWRLIFLVSVPIGIFGTGWAYMSLRDIGERRAARIDWWGNLVFAVALTALMVGITSGIEPSGHHAMSWTNPTVLGEIGGGIVLLGAFAVIESRVREPMFDLGLFRIGPFTIGNIASFLVFLARGGLQFILIIWLQGIWLPEHGYSFSTTPLWAGIYTLPLIGGLLVAGPISGLLSDRYGVRPFATLGAGLAAVSYFLLARLPVNFSYPVFASLLLLNGIGTGLFISPNRAAVMNSLPARQRGVGAGMASTFSWSAQVFSIGVFFSLMIIGLSKQLPGALYHGLVTHDVPNHVASQAAYLPPATSLFATFLGYNPVAHLLGPTVLDRLPHAQASVLTGTQFFPHLITAPFSSALNAAFTFALIVSVISAAASAVTGNRRRANTRHEAPAPSEPRTTRHGVLGNATASAPLGTRDPCPATGSPLTNCVTVDEPPGGGCSSI